MELHQIYIPRTNWNPPGKWQFTRNYVGTWPEKMKNYENVTDKLGLTMKNMKLNDSVLC